MTSDDWVWSDSEGARIFSRCWATDNPRGEVIFVHGLGEHSGRYGGPASYLARLGWSVSALDLPGHGKTSGPSGFIRSWDCLVATLEQFILRRHLTDKPTFLYGHSMGAALALQVALENAPKVQGVIASSPPVRIVQDVPGWKVALAKAFGPLVPALRFRSGIAAEFLSRDAKVVAEYLADPLVNSKVSPALGLGLVEIGPWLLGRAERLNCPVMLMHGDADGVASIEGSRDFCRRAGELCNLVEFPGFFHELHHDLGSAQVMATAAAWLDEQASAAS